VRSFSCDLHIHSTLSPCAQLEMSSRSIVEKSREVGLDIIAITDHNMAENGKYAAFLSKVSGPVVLFGMEMQTVEEVHLLALFEAYETAMALQELVYSLLPPVDNRPDYFGDQVVVDEKDTIVRFEQRLLLNSANISVNEAVSWIKAHDGLAIPSHIDSPTFSIISQLGYVPGDTPFDALEIADRKKLRSLIPFIEAKKVPIVTFSDAHCLQDIGRKRISLPMQKATFGELASALRAFGDTAEMLMEREKDKADVGRIE
jgi:3',5'-nucleoside bisphosphate phosphatase